jgi:hypothetical protein
MVMPSRCAPARHGAPSGRRFADGEVVYADHGYHRYGTEIEVPTS